MRQSKRAAYGRRGIIPVKLFTISGIIFIFSKMFFTII